MATSAISGGDLTLLRGTSQYIDNLALHSTPLVSVATLTVTAIPSLAPFVQLTVSGSMAGVKVGQMVKVTRAGALVAYAVVRLAPVGSTLYISETQSGASGYANNIETAIAVNDDVVVYNHHPMWGLYTRITNRSFKKQWDVSYSDQNRYPPPVANTGEWQSAKLSAGETTHTFRLPRIGSNTSFAFGSETITTYLWTLPSGVTLASGYATSDAVIEVVADAGYHLVQLTVTDTQSKTHTSYVWLFVSDGTTGASLSERYSLSIDSDRSTLQGREISVTLTGDTDLSDVLYPGAGFLLKEDSLFDEQALTDGVLVDSFVGYLTGDVESNHNGEYYTATFTIQSPMLIADSIPQPPQSLTEVSGVPANWTQCTSVLSNPRGYLYYAIKWHTPALLDMHDFDAAGLTTPRRRFCDYNTTTLGDACRVVAQLIVGNVGSASNGATVLRENPVYFNNTDRNSLASVITWLAQDIRPPFRINRRFNRPFAEARTGAFWTNGTSDGAGYGVKRWYQGVGKTELPNFVVTSSEGITRVKEVVGHHLASENAEVANLSLALTRNQDVVEPVYMLWNRLTVSSDFDAYDDGYSSNRMLPTQVSRTWEINNGDIIKRIELSLKPETFGQPGEEWVIGSAQTQSVNGWSLNTVTPYTPNTDDAFAGVGFAMVLDDDGQLAITYNVLDVSPVWGVLDSGLYSGTINDVCFDYSSAYYASGGNVSDVLGIWFVTTSGATLRVYYMADLLGTPQAPELITSAVMDDATVTTNARIENSEQTPSLVLVAWKDQTGTQFIRSTDTGSNWSSKANIGSTITDTVNDNAPLGMAVFGSHQLITAPTSATEYKLYYASGSGAFGLVTNTEISSSPMPLIQIANGSVAYATITLDDANYFVDFDGGGVTSYTLFSNNSISTATTTGGNPDNCAKFTKASAAGVGASIAVQFDLPAAADITDVWIDAYMDNTGSATAGAHFTVQIKTGGSGGSFVFATQVIDDALPNDASWYTLKASVSDGVIWNSIAEGLTPYTGDWVSVILNNFASTETAVDIRIDNVKVFYQSGSASGYYLYRVATYSGSSAWTDITPDAEHAPARPHDLAVDRIDTSVLNTVTDDGQHYSSANTGTAWSLEDATSDYRAFVTQGNGLLTAGTEGVALSLNGGVSYSDKTGDLVAKLGTVNTIKRVLTL